MSSMIKEGGSGEWKGVADGINGTKVGATAQRTDAQTNVTFRKNADLIKQRLTRRVYFSCHMKSASHPFKRPEHARLHFPLHRVGADQLSRLYTVNDANANEASKRSSPTSHNRTSVNPSYKIHL